MQFLSKVLSKPVSVLLSRKTTIFMFATTGNKSNLKFNEPLSFMQAIAKNYGFSNIEILNKMGGLSADNYLVLVNHKQQLVIKQHKDKTEEQLKKEELITSVLASSGIPVPLLIKNTEGKTYSYIDKSYFTLYNKINGSVLHGTQFDLVALTMVAKYLTKIHAISTNIELATTKDILPSYSSVSSKVTAISNLVRANPKSNDIQDIIQKLIDRKLDILVNFIDRTALTEQLLVTKNLVHGDFHNENLLFNNNHRLLGILDFEESHYGHPTEDIIHFIQLACCNTGYHQSNLDNAKIFLKKYRANNTISDEHIKLGWHLYLYKISSSFF